ncbi:MAG: hypothetical protein ACE5HW_01925 [Candidatus Methanofastidiosia archaeon]
MLEGAIEHRETLKIYSPRLLDHFLSITTATIIISYFLYTFQRQWSMLTIPLAVFGLFRFYYLIYENRKVASNLELIVQDKPMMLNLELWCVCFSNFDFNLIR